MDEPRAWVTGSTQECYLTPTLSPSLTLRVRKRKDLIKNAQKRVSIEVQSILTFRGEVASHPRGGLYKAAYAKMKAKFVDSRILMLKDLRAHFRGCLLGLAVGDALGGPLEFMDAKAIEKKHGRVAEMIGGGWLHLKAGDYTDDTQMALRLAESLLDQNAFAPDAIAASFVDWLNSSPPDVGNHTRQVLDKIAAGQDWKGATTNVQRVSPQSAGNGSLMRCAPVALWTWDDAQKRIEYSKTQSEITHAHQECQWSCALANAFIFHLMSCGVRDVALDRALNECRDAPGHLRKRVQLASGKMKSELKPTGYVLDTLDCAIWSFMNAESFEDAVVSAVNLGGDADTTGAVCGAFAGAFYGERQIPARWLDVLQNRDHIANVATQIAARHHNAVSDSQGHGKP